MKCVKICPFAAFCLKVMSFWLWTNLPEGKQPCHPSLEWVNKSSLNILKQINNKMITGGIVSRFKKHQRHYFRFPCSFPLACSFWDRNWENEETANDREVETAPVVSDRSRVSVVCCCCSPDRTASSAESYDARLQVSAPAACEEEPLLTTSAANWIIDWRMHRDYLSQTQTMFMVLQIIQRFPGAHWGGVWVPLIINITMMSQLSHVHLYFNYYILNL